MNRPCCPVCRDTRIVLWREGLRREKIEARDLHITDAHYGAIWPLWRCAACTYVFAWPVDAEQLRLAYQSMEDGAYEAGAEYRQLQQDKLIGQLVGVMKRKPWSLLDIGCGTGHLLAMARKRGIRCMGVEPGQWAVEKARLKGLDVRQGFFPHPEIQQTFEAITLIDIIEHVTEPCQLLTAAARQLAVDGCIQVVTPDIGSWAARLMGRRWWHYRMAHVGFFNRRSFCNLAERCGLSVVEMKRPRYYFSARYLLARLTTYTRGINWVGLFEKHKTLNRTLRTVLPLNLFDSFAYYLRRRA